MLHHLSIQNYALIRHLELDFSSGLTVVTGETGAGKSILLGAMNLILGKRADARILLNKSAKCIVEGSFNISGYKLESFFERYDLDFEKISVIRREINSHGKSRAFINDTPVTLNILQELGEQLVDIHSQHQNLSLADSDFQISILDSYAGIVEDVQQYRKLYKQVQVLIREKENLEENEKKSKAEKDYFSFLFEELKQAELKDSEQEGLEKELSVLEHAEEIRTALFNTREGLDSERGGVIDDLSSLNSVMDKIKSFNPQLEEISNRFDGLRIELQDLLQEVERFEEKINIDPERTDEITDRLNTIYSLQQKHRVNTVEALLETQDKLKQQLLGIENIEDEIKEVNKALTKEELKLKKAAKLISEKRKLVIPQFTKEVCLSVQQLGMPNGAFEVELFSSETNGKDGCDKIRFLFNANRGEVLSELSRVASGGEKSRLMLAMKSMTGKKALLPTIVFDEIDTGVSGAVADRVGAILLSLSEAMQVITITHLPQIAGKGDHHFQVFKSVSEHITSTHVKKLNPDERIVEIAKLISGQEVTQTSMDSARQLLNN